MAGRHVDLLCTGNYVHCSSHARGADIWDGPVGKAALLIHLQGSEHSCIDMPYAKDSEAGIRGDE